MELVGKEILLGIVEIDQKSQHLKLSQKLYREHKKPIDEFEIGRAYNGIISSINGALITLTLEGVIGKLPAKQSSPNEPTLIDLATVLHIGQEIEVIVTKKQKNKLWLSLKERAAA